MVLEENLLRFLNFQKMGMQWTTAVMLVLTGLLYFIPIHTLFGFCFPNIDENPEEDYYSLKLRDPNVS